MLKFTLSLLISLEFLFNFSNAQTPDWLSARQSSDGSIGNSISVDLQGNVYAVGYFYKDTIVFGSYVLHNNNSVNNYNDVFIVKYDSSGNVLWAKSVGGNKSDVAYGITNDKDGNIYITGNFYSDSIRFGNIILTTKGYRDIFVAKYDSSGNIIWAKSAGGNLDDDTYSVTCDALNNIYITGSFSSDTLTIGNIILPNSIHHYSDVFIAKFDSAGNVIWAKNAGRSDGVAKSVCLDPSGNVYIAGYFDSDSIVFQSTILTNTGGLFCSGHNCPEIFLVKYDSSGVVIWANSYGGTLDDQAASVSTDSKGNVYLTGYFKSSTITFGSTVLTNDSTAPNIFVVKCNPAGNVIWAKGAGGRLHDFATGITTDVDGNIYVTGYFHSSTITFGNKTFTIGGSPNLFLVRYDSLGNVFWVKSTAGNAITKSYCVVADVNKNVYIAGYFYAWSIVFGNTTLTSIGGNYVFFIAKMASSLVYVSELLPKGGITIYPNPTNHYLYVELSPELSRKEMKIYNIYGDLVMSAVAEHEIDVSNFAKGIYFLQVPTETETLTTKFIVE